MTSKTGFEFSILVFLGFQARMWRPRDKDPLDPITQGLLCGLPPLFLSLSPSLTERDLVHICGYSRLHGKALFIPTLKAFVLPSLRLKYSLAGQSFHGGQIKEACTGPGNKLRAFWAGIAGIDPY